MGKTISGALVLLAVAAAGAGAQPVAGTAAQPVPVTVDNFVRAETDRYFAAAASTGFGKFFHYRDFAPLEQVRVVRVNRDTLYSVGVFDLDAGPLTVTLPDAGTRYLSLVAYNEDHVASPAIYRPGRHTFSREQVGTRYVTLGVRILFDPADAADRGRANALQDAIGVQQAASGRFEVPAWDAAGLKRVRDALLALGRTLPDTRRMFGGREQVDPVRHLIGTAMAWGGNREADALYLNVTPARNDGQTVYRLRVAEVPVDGFWSVSVYDEAGWFKPNPYQAYTLNSVTAKRGADGAVDIQFGGCDGRTANCLPTPPGWNYMVRLYRARAEVLDGRWTFPQAQAQALPR
ncbi:MAG: DUF1214 domain-containing protein [Proteobacteria bacterium]|nr:DUF1214 domain-containing protein [Pseudomonadota bacterium]